VCCVWWCVRLEDNFKNIYKKTQKTKTKNKGNNTAADTATHFVQLSCPLFSQPALELSSAFRKQGREGGLLPSSEKEDREEKADYFTVVVLRRLEIRESARVRGT
jgi:hypothetical protein